MKKILKTVSLILLLATIAVSLVSCQELDDMRERQAIWSEDHSAIIINSKRYVMLPALKNGFVWNVDDAGHYINLTDADVPVLLSEIFIQDFLYCCNDGEIVSFTNKGQTYYYCREDLYDNYAADINYDDCRHYCLSYSTRTAGGAHKQQRLVLNDEEQKKFDEALSLAVPFEDDFFDSLNIVEILNFDTGISNRQGYLRKNFPEYSTEKTEISFADSYCLTLYFTENFEFICRLDTVFNSYSLPVEKLKEIPSLVKGINSQTDDRYGKYFTADNFS